jgi:hypothetical protein
MTKFFKPNKTWKFVDDTDQNKTVHNSFKFFNWTISFTKNVVQVAFIIFVIANLFIMGMITANFIRFGELVSLDTYINEIFNMFIAVIGGYIIKAGVENSVKISFSVISDYLDKKAINCNNEDTVVDESEDMS